MKIHFLSDDLRLNSGFGIVTRNLMRELKNRDFEVSITGLQTSFNKNWNYGFECFPLNDGIVTEYVRYMINLMTVKPDIVINIFGNDTGDMDRLLNIPLETGIKKRIFYTPVDSLGLGTNAFDTLKNFTENGGIVVPQCKWGYDQIKNEEINVSDYIYHGYNESIFKKLDESKYYCWYSTDTGKNETDPNFIYSNNCFSCNEKSIKCKNYIKENIGILKYNNGGYQYNYYPVDEIRNIVKGKYVFGFVGANYGVRKKIERLLKAYSILLEYKNMKDRTVLWLHTLPTAINGINVLNLTKKLKIEENVIFSYENDKSNTCSEEALCRLYNIMDCHVSASSAEGFGLPILESMACGVPQIATNICSFSELIGTDEKRGFLVDCDLYMAPNGAERGHVNINKLAESMKKMYYLDKREKEKMSKNCIKFASNYTWSKVTDQWLNLINII